jgi:Fe2+ or Zn2+ uptake regulation protein/O6-methylguanine-DNA--protein-cysteine methyltransferase
VPEYADVVQGDPADLLRAHRLRVTPQRRAILGAFRDRPDEHLSADEVHARASIVVQEIGRGTVYATLAELTELGLVAAVGSPEPVRYEINIAPHDHFRCRLCLRLWDVDLGTPPRDPPTDDGFLIEQIVMTAEGLCADCRAYSRGLAAGAAAVVSKPQLDDDLIGALACVRRESPLGALLLASSSQGIVRLAFEDHADYGALSTRARTRRGERAARNRAEALGTALESYFDGGLDAAEDVVDWGRAEEATSGSLEATRGIPYGEPRSYERLGVEIGAYECGYAMGSNPIPMLLPCHRVARGSERPDVWVGGSERLHVVRELEVKSLAATRV